MRKKIAKTPLIFILLIIVTVLLVVFSSVKFRENKLQGYSDRIKNLEELVTARHIYRNVIYTEIKENLIVDKRSLFTINYVVTAGVDLSGGFNIEVKNNAIVVNYTYPQILNIDADESSIEQYFTLERFGKLKQSDYLNIVFDEKERIKDDALNGGILERADKNLQRLISGILKEGGIKEVTFSHSYSGDHNEN